MPLIAKELFAATMESTTYAAASGVLPHPSRKNKNAAKVGHPKCCFGPFTVAIRLEIIAHQLRNADLQAVIGFGESIGDDAIVDLVRCTRRLPAR
jgi:hypothetical protein